MGGRFTSTFVLYIPLSTFDRKRYHNDENLSANKQPPSHKLIYIHLVVHILKIKLACLFIKKKNTHTPWLYDSKQVTIYKYKVNKWTKKNQAIWLLPSDLKLRYGVCLLYLLYFYFFLPFYFHFHLSLYI